jgi:hypothetical protein
LKLTQNTEILTKDHPGKSPEYELFPLKETGSTLVRLFHPLLRLESLL